MNDITKKANFLFAIFFLLALPNEVHSKCPTIFDNDKVVTAESKCSAKPINQCRPPFCNAPVNVNTVQETIDRCAGVENYKRAPVVYTEYIEVDYSDTVEPTSYKNSNNVNPSTRIIFNPVANLIYTVLKAAGIVNPLLPLPLSTPTGLSFFSHTSILCPSQPPSTGDKELDFAPFPQFFTDQWLRSAETTIGVAQDLGNCTPTVIDSRQVNFVDKAPTDDRFRAVNHHISWSFLESPGFFEGQFLVPSSFFGPIGRVTQESGGKTIIQVPRPPSPLVELVFNPLIFGGQEFTPVVFPYGYARKVQASLLSPTSWHFHNPGAITPADVGVGNKVYIRLTLKFDVDYKKLYDMLVATVTGHVPDPVALVDAQFAAFNFPTNVGPEVAYKDVVLTSMMQFGFSHASNEVIACKPGKSRVWIPNFRLPARGEVVLTFSHTHHHVKEINFFVQNDKAEQLFYHTFPRNSKLVGAYHGPEPIFWWFGNLANETEFHNHADAASNCAMHLTWHGLDVNYDRFIVEEPGLTNIYGFMDILNPHPFPIDTMNFCFIWWHPLEEFEGEDLPFQFPFFPSVAFIKQFGNISCPCACTGTCPVIPCT